MSLENIILGCVVVFLSIMLYRCIGNPEKSKKFPERIRFISEKTGQVIEMKLVEDSLKNKKKEFDENVFLSSAKVVFQMVSDAFTKGDLATLKSLLTLDVYKVFEEDILERKKKKQRVEFSLVCFDTVEILEQSDQHDEMIVHFVTEQINLLKDESGKVLEGDAMNIATVDDIWIFKKNGKSKWVVMATKSGGAVYG